MAMVFKDWSVGSCHFFLSSFVCLCMLLLQVYQCQLRDYVVPHPLHMYTKRCCHLHPLQGTQVAGQSSCLVFCVPYHTIVCVFKKVAANHLRIRPFVLNFSASDQKTNRCCMRQI
ncbi:hypothetical protein GGU11DRAFT_8609 [Lentinula aff. detonsa]|nr:hypothetical protein GGU11DRAFT_8609 [Lentinula aff. detonsa]